MGPTNYYEDPGRLWSVDTQAAPPTPVALTKLNSGEQATDANKSYQPTMLPVAVGGYRWVVFTSTRPYGNTINLASIQQDFSDTTSYATASYTPMTNTSDIQSQLWVAAIDDSPSGGDRSQSSGVLVAEPELLGVRCRRLQQRTGVLGARRLSSDRYRQRRDLRCRRRLLRWHAQQDRGLSARHSDQEPGNAALPSTAARRAMHRRGRLLRRDLRLLQRRCVRQRALRASTSAASSRKTTSASISRIARTAAKSCGASSTGKRSRRSDSRLEFFAETQADHQANFRFCPWRQTSSSQTRWSASAWRAARR